MSKAITKITVRCPHCSATQQEPELAKSTFCRKCSEYFAITPAALANAPAAAPIEPAKPKIGSYASVAAREAASAAARTPPAGIPVAPRPEARPASGGLLGKFEGMFAGKPKTRTAHCFECTSWHEVSSSAQSTTCKACGAYIDLQDYKITGSFSRNIKTRGSVSLGPKGELSSSKIICAHATLYGKMRGNLSCAGKVTIRVQGRIYGSIEAGTIVVEKGSEAVFSRPLHAQSIEVHGHMTGDVLSDCQVIIYKSGSLDGAVNATCFNVEKGGIFQGELTISPRTAASAVGETGAETEPKPLPQPVINPGILGGEQNPAMGV